MTGDSALTVDGGQGDVGVLRGRVGECPTGEQRGQNEAGDECGAGREVGHHAGQTRAGRP